MPRKLSDDPTVVVNVPMPRTMRDALDSFGLEVGADNRAHAARLAIERGLNGNATHARSKNSRPSRSTRPATVNTLAASTCLHTRRVGDVCMACGASL